MEGVIVSIGTLILIAWVCMTFWEAIMDGISRITSFRDSNNGRADISQFEALQKHANQTLYQGGQAIASNAVFNTVTYKHDPNSGYTDMSKIPEKRYDEGKTDIEVLDDRLRNLRSDIKWRKIDETALKYAGELSRTDPAKWKEIAEKKEAFMGRMDAIFEKGLNNLQRRVELGYKAINNPEYNVDPAYRKAYEAKVQEVRDFLASIGR